MKSTIIATSFGSIIFVILHLIDRQNEIITYIPTLISALTLWLAGTAYFNWKKQREEEFIHSLELENQNVLLEIDEIFTPIFFTLMYKEANLVCHLKTHKKLLDSETELELNKLSQKFLLNCLRIESVAPRKRLREQIKNFEAMMILVLGLCLEADRFWGVAEEKFYIYTGQLKNMKGQTEQIRIKSKLVFKEAGIKSEMVLNQLRLQNVKFGEEGLIRQVMIDLKL